MHALVGLVSLDEVGEWLVRVIAVTGSLPCSGASRDDSSTGVGPDLRSVRCVGVVSHGILPFDGTSTQAIGC